MKLLEHKSFLKNFDELKCEVDNFEHLGLQHSRFDDDTSCATQEHCAKEFRTIPETDLRIISPHEVVRLKLESCT